LKSEIPEGPTGTRIPLKHGPIAIYKSIGIGLQDVAIACAIVEKAEKIGGLNLGAGTIISNYDS
jgi:hypothetical protein